MELSKGLAAFVAALSLCVSAWGGDSAVKATAVPLFESASVYVDYGELNPAKCEISFKKEGDAKWEKAYPPIDAKAERQFRGSVVNLPEESRFSLEAELFDEAGNSLGKASSEFQTWSSNPPIARTLELKSQGPLEIVDVHGSPDGWVKYLAAQGTVVDGGEKAEQAVLIKNSSYVIVEGLRVKGGKRHGFDVASSENVRLLNCEISGWSRAGIQIFEKDVHYFGAFYDEKRKLINNDAAVFINGSKGVVVERCYAHDPRGTANSWAFAHPAGPNAVFVKSEGSTVIRYNDFIGSDAHRWNDAIEGWGNGERDGGFNRDADVYGNMLAFGNDDAIELDGGQMNVRFFRNKAEGFLCGVSTAPNLRGPSYVFENLVVNLGDEEGVAGSVIKNGGGSTFSKGKTFFFNNTFHTDGNGISGVGFGEDKDRALFHGLSRNNILACSGSPVNDGALTPGNSFDYDMLCNKSKLGGRYVISLEGEEKHGIVAIPPFRNLPGGDFNLKDGGPGLSEGVEVPNFSPAGPDGKVHLGALPCGQASWLPARPLPVSCDKQQLNLTADMKTGTYSSESATVSVDPNSKFSSSFKVVKNEAFAWLDVKPSSGTLEAGKELSFTATVDVAKIPKPGLLRGLFMVRMENGLSIPVTVYAKAFSNSLRETIALDKFKIHGRFAVTEDKDAVSGKALTLSGGELSKPGDACIETEIDIPKDGNYYLLVRQRAPRLPLGEHDSLFLSVDGCAPQRIDLNGSLAWEWTQLNCAKLEGVRRVDMPFKAGRHLVKILPREEILFDALMVSSDPFSGKEQ